MLDAITSQLSPSHRNLADRSIAAAAGALFGVVVCGALGLAAGRAPFSLDIAMLTLYGSAIPLSIAGFMVKFAKQPPKLPILATLWFLAFFVPGMYFSELLSFGDVLNVGGMHLPSQNFVGFRAIVVAALSGLAFSNVRLDNGAAFVKSTENTVKSVDWQRRHNEALRRLAEVDVDLRKQRMSEENQLAEFDRKLRELGVVEEQTDEECVLVIEEAGCAA